MIVSNETAKVGCKNTDEWNKMMNAKHTVHVNKHAIVIVFGMHQDHKHCLIFIVHGNLIW